MLIVNKNCQMMPTSTLLLLNLHTSRPAIAPRYQFLFCVVCSVAASVGGPVAATLIVTAIVVGVASVLVTLLVMWLVCKPRWEGQTKSTAANSSFDNHSYASKPPLNHETDSEKLESYPPSRKAPPKPAPHSRLPPPRPAPRHV